MNIKIYMYSGGIVVFEQPMTQCMYISMSVIGTNLYSVTEVQ